MVEEVTRELVRAAEEGFRAQRFEEARRQAIGDMLATVDDPEQLVHDFITYRFLDLDFLDQRRLLEEVTPEEGRAFLHDLLAEEENRVVSRVAPPKGGEDG